MQEGLANDGQPFTNFTAQENQGKICFNSTDFDATGNRTAGGVGCAACHLILILIQKQRYYRRFKRNWN
jgi:hypothetical protein